MFEYIYMKSCLERSIEFDEKKIIFTRKRIKYLIDFEISLTLEYRKEPQNTKFREFVIIDGGDLINVMPFLQPNEE